MKVLRRQPWHLCLFGSHTKFIIGFMLLLAPISILSIKIGESGRIKNVAFYKQTANLAGDYGGYGPVIFVGPVLEYSSSAETGLSIQQKHNSLRLGRAVTGRSKKTPSPQSSVFNYFRPFINLVENEEANVPFKQSAETLVKSNNDLSAHDYSKLWKKGYTNPNILKENNVFYSNKYKSKIRPRRDIPFDANNDNPKLIAHAVNIRFGVAAGCQGANWCFDAYIEQPTCVPLAPGFGTVDFLALKHGIYEIGKDAYDRSMYISVRTIYKVNEATVSFPCNIFSEPPTVILSLQTDKNRQMRGVNGLMITPRAVARLADRITVRVDGSHKIKGGLYGETIGVLAIPHMTTGDWKGIPFQTLDITLKNGTYSFPISNPEQQPIFIGGLTASHDDTTRTLRAKQIKDTLWDFFVQTTVCPLYGLHDDDREKTTEEANFLVLMRNTQSVQKLEGTVNSLVSGFLGKMSDPVTGMCIDTNECDTVNLNDCHQYASCHDVLNSFLCVCNIGFGGNGIICTDIDECLSYKCASDAVCMNNLGSFQCVCKPGLKGTSPNCIDIDECSLLRHKCSLTNAICTNTEGSYECSCNEGYTGDGTFCRLILDPCPTSNCSDRAYCTRIDDTVYNCTCNTGYEGDGTTCSDINECTPELSLLSCPENHTMCQNSDGSFECFCLSGFIGDGVSCNDIDECNTGAHDCNTTISMCNNIPGSYNCSCKVGYLKQDNNTCILVDACAANLHNCHANASCESGLGSDFEINQIYTCTCKMGWTGNGTTCTETTDCPISLDPCGNNAICQIDTGQMVCSCKKGYQGDPYKSCSDIDECSTGVHQCNPTNSMCNNTVGDYNCSCNAGYNAKANRTCALVDSCLANLHNCHENATCHSNAESNQPSWFACLCNLGWTGDGKNCSDTTLCPTEENPCGGNATCKVDKGQFVCTCNQGYSGDAWDFCFDLDECSTGAHQCNTNISVCSNTEASYNCSCNVGYLAKPNRTCDLVDKCLAEVDDCHNHATCITIDKDEYICHCNLGWTGNGQTCTATTECPMSSNPCGGNSTCQVENGEMICSCNQGYTGNSYEYCLDIDECSAGIHHCNTSISICTNLEANYNCSCNAGYRTGPNYTCVLIDACLAEVDNCHDNATCIIINENHYICHCNLGWTGNGQDCTATNACPTSINPCVDLANCKVENGQIICTCNKGYTGNATAECTDIDECSAGVHQCNPASSVCNNTVGDYNCSCNAGYLTRPNRTCNLVDSCLAKVHNCHENATCHTSSESTYLPTSGFVCSCNLGWTGDGQTCIETTECPTEQNPCAMNAACKVVEGRMSCSCNPGYTGNGTENCTDLDECQDSTHQCHLYAVCNNTVGSYNCFCNPGYHDDGNGICTLVDSCLANTHDCHINATCYTTQGPSYMCRCNLGWTGEGRSCTVTNECTTLNNPCAQLASCRIDEGYIVCTCNTGYTGDGLHSCADLNECTAYNGSCEYKKKCENTVGSFACSCKDGYTTLENSTCKDINECELQPQLCTRDTLMFCVNTDGSYKCDCETGFMIGPDGDCINFNECELLTGLCSEYASCFDSLGSFRCVCNFGYYGDGQDCYSMG